jgi:hypothetical protein
MFDESKQEMGFTEIDTRLKSAIKKYLIEENEKIPFECIHEHSKSSKCPYCNMDRVTIYNSDVQKSFTTFTLNVNKGE